MSWPGRPAPLGPLARNGSRQALHARSCGGGGVEIAKPPGAAPMTSEPLPLPAFHAALSSRQGRHAARRCPGLSCPSGDAARAGSATPATIRCLPARRRRQKRPPHSPRTRTRQGEGRPRDPPADRQMHRAGMHGAGRGSHARRRTHAARPLGPPPLQPPGGLRGGPAMIKKAPRARRADWATASYSTQASLSTARPCG